MKVMLHFTVAFPKKNLKKVPGYSTIPLQAISWRRGEDEKDRGIVCLITTTIMFMKAMKV
jgi:hypothetical protein